MLLPEDKVEQSEAGDISMAHMSTSVEDAGRALAQSVASLAIDDEDLPMRSATNRTTAGVDPTINDAIDQLTEQLAAFCFEHLENSLDQGTGDLNNDLDKDMDGEVFQCELSVRDHCHNGISIAESNAHADCNKHCDQ